MQSPSQAMQVLETPFAARADVKANKLPLLSLITFSPMGNPLSGLSAGQRNLFFEYLLLSLHNQRKEQLERAAALNKRIVLPASLSAAALSTSRPSSEQNMRQVQFGEEMKNFGRNSSAVEVSATMKKAYLFSSADIENFKNDLKANGIAQKLDEINAKKINAMEKGSEIEMELGGNIYIVEKTLRGALNMRKKAGETNAQEEKFASDGARKKKDEGSAPGSDSGVTGATGGAEALATKADEEATAATGVAGWKFSSLFKKRGEEEKGGENGNSDASSPSALGQKNILNGLAGQKNAQDSLSMSAFSSAYKQKAGIVSGAIEQMVPVIDDYARGNAKTEKKVVGNLHENMRASNYKTDDLMASLLLVIEDDAWSGEESGLGSSKPYGGATRLASLVPQKLRSTAQDSAVMRLASVREMLRYYFRMHPEDYQSALASALGITSDQEEDSTFLQERLAFELASIGSFALAQKILAEVKKKKELDAKKELDTKECLMELGYVYDAKKKRLILGKRTCGKLAEARAIIGLLLASARKKK